MVIKCQQKQEGAHIQSGGNRKMQQAFDNRNTQEGDVEQLTPKKHNSEQQRSTKTSDSVSTSADHF